MPVFESPGRAAILGAGLIGMDLADRIHLSPRLALGLVAGRSAQSSGLVQAAARGYATSSQGLAAVVERGPFDVVFDASNASAHESHWQALRATGATLIDLTPTELGTFVVPTVNAEQAAGSRHINLISCGGQASIPILNALGGRCRPSYIEVVCTGASGSAGRATRLNLDEYIDTTQSAIRAFTRTPEVKVLVNLTPARPAPPFRVVMTVLAPELPSTAATAAVEAAAEQVRSFAPGYAVTSIEPAPGCLTVAVEVTALGGRIPACAGNLDIINAAALLLAEHRTLPTR
ncbi:acetaldehyde dehydrogenase (acetylating) [Streptomyces sp. N35]|uniref:acetaldehyde dehydrogenase (acetylating) n=1 Tax=Streptomyces sp. N35 TaxID=2795730 RepID=UPI0018F5365A|nr:acetaldehyde dehydrogenase (acetylating) [Streptomyces sp. N35]